MWQWKLIIIKVLTVVVVFSELFVEGVLNANILIRIALIVGYSWGVQFASRMNIRICKGTLNYDFLSGRSIFCTFEISGYTLTLWTPRVYLKSPPTTPNCLRVRQP